MQEGVKNSRPELIWNSGLKCSDSVVDIFDAAGLEKPEISGLEILSDDFLKEVQGMKLDNH